MKNRGFTLIELLLYTVLIGLVVMATAVLLSVLQKQRVRSQVIMEVEDQGVAAMQIITQIIRNSTAINSPAAGATGTSVSVNVPTGSLSPTVFAVSSGQLTMTEGVNPMVNLTSSKVTVSSVSFSNLTRAGSFGTARIVYTVSYNNPDGIPEYTYSKTFTSDASLR